MKRLNRMTSPLSLKNDNAEAYNNKAEIFLSKKFVDAIEMFKKV